MSQLRPIYYDTETTGISCKKDRIIEFAAYDVIRDRSFSTLIQPEVAIPPEATNVHQITDAMVAEAPIFSAIIPQLLEFFSGEVVLIAHNNDAFDVLFLREEFQRAQHPFPDHWKFVDSLKWARRYRPDLPKHSLQFLREIYGIEANNAHRALDDVMVLREVFSAMTDDLSMEEITALLSRPEVLTRMPFGKYKGQPLQNIPKSYVRWMSRSSELFESNPALKEAFEKLGLLEEST